MAQIDIGKLSFNHRGNYDASTAYVLNDVVYYNGSAYVAKQSTTGNLPTDTNNWNLFVLKGTDTSVLTTQGDVLYHDGSALARLGAGTSGQFLKTQGTGANPVWGDVVSKVLGTSYISYTTRFQPPTSPTGANSYAGTTNIFPANTFQYTKTIQNSHLMGWLVISGMGGSQVFHGRGTVSFSTDGSTVSNSQVVSTGTDSTINGNHTNYLFKVANNAAAGTITIDPRYGGNGNRFWSIINPSSADNAEYSVATGCYMFIMEVAN